MVGRGIVVFRSRWLRAGDEVETAKEGAGEITRLSRLRWGLAGGDRWRSRSTKGGWGGGGDSTIPSPEMSPKHPLLGIELQDSLHSRQACPASNSFHQGVNQRCPREGLFSCRLLPKQGQTRFVERLGVLGNREEGNQMAGGIWT